eukprot:488319-Rhodomonas_salina.7
MCENLVCRFSTGNITARRYRSGGRSIARCYVGTGHCVGRAYGDSGLHLRLCGQSDVSTGHFEGRYHRVLSQHQTRAANTSPRTESVPDTRSGKIASRTRSIPDSRSTRVGRAYLSYEGLSAVEQYNLLGREEPARLLFRLFALLVARYPSFSNGNG